jgi:hypothetical protein
MLCSFYKGRRNVSDADKYVKKEGCAAKQQRPKWMKMHPQNKQGKRLLICSWILVVCTKCYRNNRFLEGKVNKRPSPDSAGVEMNLGQGQNTGTGRKWVFRDLQITSLDTLKS